MGRQEYSDEAEDEEDYISQRKRKYVQRGRRDWSELAVFDKTAMLESEIKAAILAIAREMQESNLVEWPEVKRMDHKKTISLRVNTLRQEAKRL